MLIFAPMLWLACADPEVTPSEPARLHISPSAIDLGEVALHDHAIATLTLSNTGEEALELWDIRIVDDRARAYFTVGSPSLDTLEPGDEATVEIALSARSVGPIEGELELLTPLGLSSPVPLRATVRGVPTLRARPDSLDFGELRVGESAVLDLQLSNVGNDVLLLGRVEAGLGESAFSVLIDPYGARLGPGDGDGLLSVQFAPTLPGRYTEVFVLSSNDPNAPQLAVAASGTAR